MGARGTFTIASTQILKKYFAYIINMVLNVQHKWVRYTCKSYEKAKNRLFVAKIVLGTVCAQARENLEILS